MGKSENNLDHIQHLLESKSTGKQIAYKHIVEAFEQLAKESQRVTTELIKKTHVTDDDVTVHFKFINEQEFEIKLAGDLVIFVLHTNVVTFDENHEVMKDSYIRENPVNRYFGQIMIYNFMADSVKFARVNDPGYLVARLLINHQNRFVVEGQGGLKEMYNKISEKPVTVTDLNTIVQHALMIAIDNDLIAPPFPDVHAITLHQKIEKTSELGAGQKIGFRMSYQNKLDS
jgi:hypothetical protein